MKNTITVDPFDLAPKSHSSFWMQERNYDELGADITSLLKLSSLQRAISGFVKIICQKDIPVRFSTSARTSSTDNHSIIISADTTEENFDPIVGRACHEAAHCLQSDFDMLKDLKNRIPSATVETGKKLGMTEPEVLLYVKGLWNYVEDARIDQYMYDIAPGWQGYYHAMYRTDWHSEKMSKALKSSNFRDETLRSYDVRIIGLTNKDCDLKALKGLKEIAEVVDIRNINRLKTSLDALKIAVKMFAVIAKYLDPKKIEEDKKKKEEQQKKKGQKKNQPGDDNGNGTPMPGDEGEIDPNGQPKPGDTDEDGDGDEEEGEGTTKDNSDQKPGEDIKGDGKKKSDDGEEETDETTPGDGELSPEEKKAIEEAIKLIKQMLEGEKEVVPISQDQQLKLDILSESDATVENVSVNDEGTIHSIPVTVIRNVSESFFSSDMCEFSKGYGNVPRNDGWLEPYVQKGIEMGRLLGSRIKIRNEEHKVRTIRRDHGKLVRRLLHETGFGNTKIFGQTRTLKYKKAVLHISIDGSSSMGKDDIGNAVKLAVAIAKFSSMTTNIRVIISIRYSSGYKAIIATLYDSKRDKFVKIRTMFPYIKSAGGTPEGLCFAAIQKEIESTSDTTKSYFLNLSDGEPCYSYNGDGGHFSYGGSEGLLHTKGEVDKMRRRGITIMSYLIGGSPSTWAKFLTMYGKDARDIDTDSVPQLAHTLEQMFLEKD